MDVDGAAGDVAAVGMQGEEHRPFGQGRGHQAGLEGRLPGEGELHLPLAGRGPGLQRPRHQEGHLVASRHRVAEARARQQPQRLAEQGLGRLVGRLQCAVRADDQGRIGPGLERRRLEALGYGHETA